MLAFCDDILKVIIEYSTDEVCVMLARVCWRLHDLVHRTRTRILITDNIFEAVRCDALLSFKYADVGMHEIHIGGADIDATITLSDLRAIAAKMNHVCDDILKTQCDANDAYAIVRLMKRGILCNRDSSRLQQRSIIIHAITYGQSNILAYMKEECSDEKFQQYCAYGYAKVGDYDNFKRCIYTHDDALKYYARIGGNADIIRLVGNEDMGNAITMASLWLKGGTIDRDVGMLLIKRVLRIIKRDDVKAFNRIDTFAILFSIAELVIKYNAINIVKNEHIHRAISVGLRGSTSYAVVDMTLEMAKLLLELRPGDMCIVKLIVSSCNYRLTEMLRERGLYSKKLTMKSSHFDFV